MPRRVQTSDREPPLRTPVTVERVTHMGRFYAVNDAATGVKPVRPGGPPVCIAGQADVSVRRAARDRRGLAYRQYQARQSDRIDAGLSRARDGARGMLRAIGIQMPMPLGGLENRTAEGSFEEFARDRFIIGDKVSVKEEIAR
jgi:alkanesulfonate monooxygenase SsuD/methylene tetrahydromethanopterin reductase-like flavin-dependent oxidoreductase (luciferase family)